MIFNSISNQINQPRSLNTNNSQYQYFYRESQIPKQEYSRTLTPSKIASMNNKIIDNLEYLKYRDRHRQDELRFSRVSNYTTKSLKNKSNSVVKTSSNDLQSRLRSHRTQKFFQQNFAAEKDHGIGQLQSNNQIKDFLRKPVTIDMMNIGSKIGGKNESHQFKSSINNRQVKPTKSDDKFYDLEYQPTFVPESRLMSRSAVDSRIRIQDKVNSIAKIDQNQLKPKNKSGQIKEIREIREAPKDPVSPLPAFKSSKNKQIILAATLIALGIILFLLQALK